MSTRTVVTVDGDGRELGREEVEVADDVVVADTLGDRLDAALDGLRSYLGLATPTAAQTTAAVRLLCRVGVASIRLQRGRLEDLD